MLTRLPDLLLLWIVYARTRVRLAHVAAHSLRACEDFFFANCAEVYRLAILFSFKMELSAFWFWLRKKLLQWLRNRMRSHLPLPYLLFRLLMLDIHYSHLIRLKCGFRNCFTWPSRSKFHVLCFDKFMLLFSVWDTNAYLFALNFGKILPWFYLTSRREWRSRAGYWIQVYPWCCAFFRFEAFEFFHWRRMLI